MPRFSRSYLALLLLTACAAHPPVPATAPASAGADAPAAIVSPPSIASSPATPSLPVAPVEAATPPAPVRAEALDPLAIDGTTEAATVPDVQITPRAELRRKSRADLDLALAMAKKAPSVDDAARTIATRVGKPTWTEAGGQRRVWVAPDGARCHRLTLDGDGSLDLEVAPAAEWKTLGLGAQQATCSGEVKRHGL